MAKFRTSRVGGNRKDATYSTGKQFSYNSQDEKVERRKQLLKGKETTQPNEMFLAEQGMQALEESMWRKYQQEELRLAGKNNE